jgi:hypothetical protein
MQRRREAMKNNVMTIAIFLMAGSLGNSAKFLLSAVHTAGFGS